MHRLGYILPVRKTEKVNMGPTNLVAMFSRAARTAFSTGLILGILDHLHIVMPEP